MWPVVRQLSLGVSLIFAASLMLLLSDSPRPKSESAATSSTKAKPVSGPIRIALFQLTSQPIIDEGAQGVIESLAEGGYSNGGKMLLNRMNAEGDLSTANTIAQELAGGGYDLVITLSTPAMQAMANANKRGRVRHIFGLVSDPKVAGVGVGAEPLDHPPHLVGYQTLPPVDEALRMAHQMNPRLSRIGIAWNPAEINSEICTKLARKTCAELKIQLEEANVENTVAVKEGVNSLIGRQIDAIIIGGDSTVLGAVELVTTTARNARIPVITCMPGNARKGTLFDWGANYYEVGRNVGRLAVRVLDGEEISKIPVELLIPPKLFLNKQVALSLRDSWVFPPDVLEQAKAVIDENGKETTR